MKKQAREYIQKALFCISQRFPQHGLFIQVASLFAGTERRYRQVLPAGRSQSLLWLIYCQPPQNFGQKSGTEADAPRVFSTPLCKHPASTIPTPRFPCFQLRVHTQTIKLALARKWGGQEGEEDNMAPHLTLLLPSAPMTAEGQGAGPGHVCILWWARYSFGAWWGFFPISWHSVITTQLEVVSTGTAQVVSPLGIVAAHCYSQLVLS